MRWFTIFALALGVAACGSDPVSTPRPEVSGTASQALDCRGEPYSGGSSDYMGGLEEVRSSPEDAVENFVTESGAGPGVPGSGYRLGQQKGDRVLMSYNSGSRIVIAFALANGMTDYLGQQGWGVDSWAQCDPAELPDELQADSDVQVWSRADGRQVASTVISSSRGAEHCDWQDITFLRLGHDRTTLPYVRDVEGSLNEFLVGTFEREADLPADAKTTGFRRDGRELWFAKDRSAAYLVDVKDPTDIELWPRAKTPIGCA